MAASELLTATADANTETTREVPLFLSAGNWSNLDLAAVVLLTIGIVWLVLFLWERLQRRRVEPIIGPQSLFGRLCDAHGLALTERQQLERLIHRLQLPNPAHVFVDPRVLENLLAPENSQSDEIGRLGVKLFGPEFLPDVHPAVAAPQ